MGTLKDDTEGGRELSHYTGAEGLSEGVQIIYTFLMRIIQQPFPRRYNFYIDAIAVKDGLGSNAPPHKTIM